MKDVLTEKPQFSFLDMLDKYSSMSNNCIFDLFPTADTKVLQAARYSLSIGGKRLRPSLCLCVANMFSSSDNYVKVIAASMEYIHTYSLIHDDLPCMDDDDLRRGKPSCHIVFGDGIATLAGDCLLNLAFETLLAHAATQKHIQAASLIADSAGYRGMIGGQCVDLISKLSTVEQLKELAYDKTGKLIIASLAASGIVSGASQNQIQSLKEFGRLFGLAFQLRDDLLDEIGSTQKLGKKIGSDKKQGKTTFLTLLGKEKCLQMLVDTTNQARHILSALPQSDFLQGLLDFNLSRLS